jgi:hypothetical protein
MKNILHIILVLSLSVGLAACSSQADPKNTDGLFSPLTVKKEAPRKVTIPSGTRLRITLIDGVSTVKSSAGDQFMGSLSEPVVVSGKKVLDKGTKVRGRVVEVNESGRIKGRASIQMILTEIVHKGDNVSISTKPFVAIADDTKKRDAGIIAGGAGVGAVVGAIAGGKKGAGIGALIGGGAGTGTVLATKGKELTYPPESHLSFALASPVQI